MDEFVEDAAFGLEGIEGVEAVYALPPRVTGTQQGRATGFRVAVVLRPYGGATIARATTALHRVMSPDSCAQVGFFDGAMGGPPVLGAGRPVVLGPDQRARAAARAAQRPPPPPYRSPIQQRELALFVGIVNHHKLADEIRAAYGEAVQIDEFLDSAQAYRLIHVAMEGPAAAEPIELDLLLVPLCDVWLHTQLLVHNSPIADRIVFVSSSPPFERVFEAQARRKRRPVVSRSLNLDGTLGRLIDDALTDKGLARGAY